MSWHRTAFPGQKGEHQTAFPISWGKRAPNGISWGKRALNGIFWPGGAFGNPEYLAESSHLVCWKAPKQNKIQNEPTH
jgi:hypothetical protein